MDLINLTALAPPTVLLSPTKTDDVLPQVASMNLIESAKHLLSGALTADTYSELVSISAPGSLRFCGVYRIDATSRTVGLKIVLDGVTVLADIDAALASSGTGWIGVGFAIGANNGGFEAIRFNASLSIHVRSSVTETDKIVLVYSTAVTT